MTRNRAFYSRLYVLPLALFGLTLIAAGWSWQRETQREAQIAAREAAHLEEELASCREHLRDASFLTLSALFTLAEGSPARPEALRYVSRVALFHRPSGLVQHLRGQDLPEAQARTNPVKEKLLEEVLRASPPIETAPHWRLLPVRSPSGSAVVCVVTSADGSRLVAGDLRIGDVLDGVYRLSENHFARVDAGGIPFVHDTGDGSLPERLRRGEVAPERAEFEGGWGAIRGTLQAGPGAAWDLLLANPASARAAPTLPASLVGPAGGILLAGSLLSGVALLALLALSEHRRRLDEETEAGERFRSTVEELQTIFSSAVEAILVLRRNGMASGEILLHNPAASALLGLGETPLDGRDFSLFVPSALRRDWEGVLADALRLGRIHYTTRRLKADGAEAAVEGIAVALRGGADGRVLLMERDAAEHERAEKERAALETRLRRAQTLDAISTLSGGVAHEFNNCLAVILGYTELLLEEKLEPSQLQSLEEILIASRRASALVDQLLLFSRQTASERAPLALNLLLKEAVKRFHPTMPPTILLVDRVWPDVPRVNGDPGALLQVIEQLLKNALDALKERGGTITVRLDVADGAGEPLPEPHTATGAFVRLQVSDDGPGMPPEVLAKAFDPFYSTKEFSSGAGLGLSVVHGVVEAHGGTVTLVSEPGQGATVTLLLPALPA